MRHKWSRSININNNNNKSDFYITQFQRMIIALWTLLPPWHVVVNKISIETAKWWWLLSLVISFLKLSQLPSEYTACAAKYIAQSA